MGFLDDYDALTAPAAQLQLFQEWLFGKPDLLFSELRAKRPIFQTPGPVVLSRYRDVVEVLDYNQIYSVAPWGEAMRRNNGGPNFVLGMEDGAQYRHEISILRLAVRREDADAVVAGVAQHARTLAAQFQTQGVFDIVDGYSRLVPTLFAGDYFGVPGPTPQVLMEWQRQIFVDIFFNLSHDPTVQANALTAAKSLRDYIQGLIDQTRAAGAPYPDNALGRLLSLQTAPESRFTDEQVHNNLSGCVSGIIDNASNGIVAAIDILLSRPDALPGAIAAAQADQDDVLTRYVMEAMRFRAPAPLLLRLSLADHLVARGTEREAKIPTGALVFASTSSAMLDENELDNPQAFDLQRPLTQYIHFGWGLHECLGKYLAIPLIVQSVKALLLLKNLRRADGEAGQATYTGPFPKAFSLACDPS